VVAGDGHVDRSQPASAGLPGVEDVSRPGPQAGRSGHLALPESSSQPVRVDGLWEQAFSKVNLTRALRRVERNGGRTRCRWAHHGGVPGMAQRALGRGPRRARCRDLQALTRPAGRDPQARWWCAAAGCPYGAGSVGPAGHRAGARAHFRPGVLGAQLRVPSGAQRPPGGRAVTAVAAGRLAVGGRCRPGEVLGRVITLLLRFLVVPVVIRKVVRARRKRRF
jgi:hypothetical protein